MIPFANDLDENGTGGYNLQRSMADLPPDGGATEGTAAAGGDDDENDGGDVSVDRVSGVFVVVVVVDDDEWAALVAEDGRGIEHSDMSSRPESSAEIKSIGIGTALWFFSWCGC